MNIFKGELIISAHPTPNPQSSKNLKWTKGVQESPVIDFSDNERLPRRKLENNFYTLTVSEQLNSTFDRKSWSGVSFIFIVLF